MSRGADSDDLVQLGSADPAPVLQALRAHLESVAHHHAHVTGFSQPEREFDHG